MSKKTYEQLRKKAEKLNWGCRFHPTQKVEIGKKLRENKPKCHKPEPDFPYGRDEFDDIHFWCKNCGQEVIQVKLKGEKKYKWYHGHLCGIPILD